MNPAALPRHVACVETFIVTLPRDTPYLGPLAEGESVNSRGYIVRKGNGTIYPTVDRSVVVRVTASDGAVGWGETYGICAPRATCEIINDLLAPVLLGRDPEDVEQVWDDLYGLMRVRGCGSGFHVDAIAALDIALWDLRAQGRGLPLARLLADAPAASIPCYLSGLPAATLAERVELARSWQRDGITAFKFAAVVSHEGVAEEFAALRAGLGPDADILADLHWKFSAEEAIALARQVAPYRPRLLEAPVKPELIGELAAVCAACPGLIAGGEEWYTEYEAALRLSAARVAVVQPEMAHTGITQFRRIAALAQAHGAQVAPHATIGTGIFLAASLHVSATLPNLWQHEWQHSVFERNLLLLDTDMAARAGHYTVPTGAGLGAAPNARFWDHAVPVA
ncbi:mandelate racemase/muconate lactonizing enzyme family protein [Massilia arenosa]|uniref:Mandelate racemase/muconate lactonizing enzyme family protein n=1 Tax=Zemynaea arenosa TaxID=2561931 RepID=A0A4Y9SID8_9BURK|nr:mandelate racemase/muconate lactonizing enzyme family protein [Massilia arenosa]TFW21833.1 mandelate racemase/muconate lactonizing enzyme family protein [Massilia arenosa]